MIPQREHLSLSGIDWLEKKVLSLIAETLGPSDGSYVVARQEIVVLSTTVDEFSTVVQSKSGVVAENGDGSGHWRSIVAVEEGS